MELDNISTTSPVFLFTTYFFLEFKITLIATFEEDLLIFISTCIKDCFIRLIFDEFLIDGIRKLFDNLGSVIRRARNIK